LHINDQKVACVLRAENVSKMYLRPGLDPRFYSVSLQLSPGGFLAGYGRENSVKGNEKKIKKEGRGSEGMLRGGESKMSGYGCA